MGSGGSSVLRIEHFDILAWLFAANFILAIVCAIREVMNSRTSQGSIAWILSLLMLSFPTTLIYLVFGWKLFDSYARIQNHSGRRERARRADAQGLSDLESNKDWRVLTEVAQLPFLKGNRARLLIDGQATFASMFQGIGRAQSYILVQFYIIRDDELGREFADLLIARAKDGVRVRVLYDDVGSAFLPRAYVARLRSAGIEVSAFNQRHKLLRFYGPTRINYRSHRKVVVVDGREAWLGGHNVGVEYLGQDRHFGHWRDTHVHIEGPTALAIALIFREDWEWATGEVLPATVPERLEAPGAQPILLMATGPADAIDGCAIAFTEAISRAQRRLWIVSPYFVPGLDLQTALMAAVLRGVDVRILIPRKPDHRLVWLASTSHANQMVRYGIKIYRYMTGFLHEKVILVDSEIAGVGTVNLDNRSFNINFEATLWFTDPEMIHSVEAMLQEDFRASHLTTQEELDAQPWGLRFISQGARLLSPIL